MKTSKIFLKRKLQKIKFKITKTQHLLIKKKIMVYGNFILDTGASNSCVGFESVDLFALEAKSRLKAAEQEQLECLHNWL
jgi:hypothetical protein